MLKKSLLIMLLMALFTPWAAQAQTTVEIGEGTAGSNRVPIDTYYNYSITEQLYTADEIGMAGNITSISFNYINTAAKDFPIEVYMKNVDDADLSTAGISLADADLVFEGTLSVTAAGWYTIELDAPFAYDGTSNLLIGVNKGYVYWFSGSSWQCTGTEVTMARYTENDNDPYDTSTTPSTASANRPNIQMTIVAGGGPVCNKPDTFAIYEGSLTTTSVTLTWEGGSGNYDLEYKKSTDDEYTTYNTSSTAFSLENLMPGTTYNARVRSVCSDGVSGYKTLSFQTLFGIPLVESFGTSIPSGWTKYTGLMSGVLAGGDLGAGTSSGWLFGSNNGVFDDHVRVNIYGTSCQYWLALPTLNMENNVELTFEVAYTAYSGTGAPQQTGTDDIFAVLIQTSRGWEVLRQWDNAGSQYVLNDFNTTPSLVSINLSSYAGQDVTIAFYGESTESNADNNLHIDNVSVDYIPACPKPTGLAVNYEGGTTATVTWDGNATSYQLDVNGTTYTSNTNSYNLTGLELATTYEVKVRANCGTDGYSDWSNTVSFTTDACMPEDQIVVNYALTDSYGDGWNNNYILVIDESCTIVEQLTIESGNSASGTLKVCGSYVQFLWYAGSYPTETSWVFTDNAGNVLFEGAGTAAMANLDVLYTIDNNPYQAPVDVAASEVGPHSAKLSWTETGTATAWQIKLTEGDDEEGTIINANSNPFVITGLTPETEYFAQVRATGANGTSIWTCLGADFTTTVACPNPTNLNVTAYPTSADVAWEGFADAYDLEWALLPASESKDALWLQYDDGTVVTNVGNSTIYEWTWAVMYPADMLQGNQMLSKVAFYETSYYSAGDPITINIYSGGDSEPGTLVYTENVTCTGTVGIHEVILSSSVNIDPAQNLWITLTSTTIDRPMAMSAVDEANGRWVDNGGWMDIGTALASVSTYTFMIRGYVEPGFDPEELDWNPVSGITSPYTLEGLQPETTYVVRVKANCGGEDGESDWTMTTFKTPSACDMPINLAANDITYNSAKLSWIGYQESYNVRYRSLAKLESVTLTENFDEGMGDWTTIDADGDGYTWVSSMNPGDYHNAGVDLTGNGHNGSAQFVISGSYSNSLGEALTPDNYLVSPQIELGGGMEFWVSAQDAGYFAEHFGVAVSTSGNTDAADFTTIAEWTLEDGQVWHKYVVDLSAYTGQGYVAIRHFNCTDMFILNLDDISFGPVVPTSAWTTVTVNEPTYTLTGLTPETDYEWQIQGVNASCGTLDWTEIQSFTTLEQLGQTLALGSGWNWCSANVNFTLNDLKAALVDALPGATSIQIKTKDYYTKYNGRNWRGSAGFNSLDMTQMFKVELASGMSCEFTLAGDPIDPSTIVINISNGSNWITYPLDVTMQIADAFAGFAVRNDQVKSKDGYTTKIGTGNAWRGTISTLDPGQGYIYKSVDTATKPFTFTAPSKSAPRTAVQTVNSSARKNVKTKTFDLIPTRK
jgi:hypothetical protein